MTDLPKNYRVALVVTALGLNSNQVAEIKTRIKTILGLRGEDSRIDLIVPGFELEKPESLIPLEVRNLRHVFGVNMVYLPCPRSGALQYLRRELTKDCDEIWCCPGLPSQARVLSTNRVSMVYYDGIADGRHGHRYKMLGPWVSPVQAVVKVTNDKKPKKGNVWVRKWN